MIRLNWNNALFDMTDIGGGPLGEDIPRHAHAKDSYELHFIVGGKGKLITDTNEYELSAGNFFITGPNIYHEQTADKSDPVRDVFIMLQAV
ncbi:MAG: cupin domain-containing protein, partial [Eubacterium sp.]|nr:cupin domain-containing protein [Eubacterium sp.]